MNSKTTFRWNMDLIAIDSRGLQYGMIGLLLSLAAQLCLAQDATTQLTSFEYSGRPGNLVEVTLNFSGPAPGAGSFTTDNPARIVLDFPGVQLAALQKSKTVGIGPVRGLNAVEAGGRTRFVVELVNSAPFELVQLDDKYLISIGTQQGIAPVSAPPGVTLQTTSFNTSTPSVTGIDFKRSASGAGQIIVSLSDPNTQVDLRDQGNRIVVELKETVLPEHLDRNLDVTDFATPVTFVDTKMSGDTTLMEIRTTGDNDQIGYQSGNTYIVEVKPIPLTEEEEVALEDKKYTGQRISFTFQSIEVKAALKLLAEMVNFNMVAGSQVQGDVTLKLNNVPWDQALDIILEANNLGYREIGNVWIVDLKENIRNRERETLEAQREIKELEPLRTEIVQISYSNATAISTMLKTGGSGQGQTGSFLSDRGRVSVDDRTNSLLVQDTADRLEEIRVLVNELDKPVRQVLIESRVVIANDDFSKDLGVRFGFSSDHGIRGVDGGGVLTGGGNPGNVNFGGAGVSFNDGTNENLIVDLPANPVDAFSTPAAWSLAIGKLDTYLLQLELSALQSEGRGEIIASPRVVTSDKEEAVIRQGREIQVLGAVGANAAQSAEFEEAVLELRVTPQITPDDRVIMRLGVTNDDVRADGGFNRRAVTTNVLVDNGETVVLGGVYQETSNRTVNRVPFLGSLPVLGALFRNTQQIDSKQELLIFVTPKILREKVG